MTSQDLPADKALKLREQIARHLRYFNRLEERLKRLGFPPEDPLMREATAARAKVQDLLTMAHYASCKRGVGREEKR